MLVTCAYCGCKTVDKKSDDYVSIKGKNYHKSCGELQEQKDKFFSYVCFTLGLKAPGPRIYTQAKRFIENNGYTYEGMYRTFWYIQEKKKKRDKRAIEERSIGLIPYYYDEAQSYFKRIDSKAADNQKAIEILKEKEKIISTKMDIEKRCVPTYNIDEIE